MRIGILISTVMLSVLATGCYVRKSYTLDEYRTKNDLRITSVTKTNGERVSFFDDSGKYDPALGRVYGHVAKDSEATIPSQEIRLVNTERPNPIIPIFEYLAVAVGVVVAFVIASVLLSPPTIIRN